MTVLDSLRDNLSRDLSGFFANVCGLSDSSIDEKRLVEIWCSAKAHMRAPAKAPSAKSSSKSSSKSDPNGPKCDYFFQKGANTGKVCGDSVCSESTSKCRKHMKFEGVAPSAHTKILSSAKEIASGASRPIAVRPASAQLSISRNDYGNYEHKATNLVFNLEKFVYGKQVGEKVLPLTAADIENCKRHSFKFLPEAVAKPESTEPENDEEEVEDYGDDGSFDNGIDEDADENEEVGEEEVEEVEG